MVAIPPPNLTNHNKLEKSMQKAQKFKHSPHGHLEINVVVYCLNLLEPLELPINKSWDEISCENTVSPKDFCMK